MKSLLDGTTEWRYNPKWSLDDMLESPIWRDSRLSAKSKGIWAYMKSKPFGWDFSAERMAKEFTDGRRAIQNGLQELESIGYLGRQKLKTGRVYHTIVDDPWVGIEPTIEKSTIAKYHVFLDECNSTIGHAFKDAMDALMLAYSAYFITKDQAIEAIDGRTFTSYSDILDWLDTDRDSIDEKLNLPLAANF